jgi:hypothetical protein
MRCLPLIMLLAAGCGLALAACGSSGKSSSGTAKGTASAFLAFSTCMRSRGVTNFPDPSAGGGFHITPGEGIDPQSPSFQAAQHTCKKLLPGGGPGPVSQAQKVQLLANAQCMREHGVPNYPDPTFPPGGGIEQFLGPGINPQSPAFQSAARHCNSGSMRAVGG